MFDHCAGSSRNYFNSTHLPDNDLRSAIIAAAHQDELVMALFHVHAQHWSGYLAPSQVHRLGEVKGSSWLLTSVRRSMSVLSRAGSLIKTDQLRTGPHGRPETTWRLPTQTRRPSCAD